MSLYVSGWVSDLTLASPLGKVLLYALAEPSDHDGVCWPSRKTLLRATGMSAGSLTNHLRALEDAGLIARHADAHTSGAQSSNTYVITGYHGSKQHRQMQADRRAGKITEPAKHPRRDALKTPAPLSGEGYQDMVRGSQQVAGGYQQVAGGMIPDSTLEPLVEPVTKPAEVSRANAHVTGSASDGEVAAIEYLTSVRGMERVKPDQILSHLREVISVAGIALDDSELTVQALRFRDYWQAKRMNQPRDKAWRQWRVAVTNWFTRIGTNPRRSTPPAPPMTNVDRSLANLRAVVDGAPLPPPPPPSRMSNVDRSLANLMSVMSGDTYDWGGSE